MARTRNAGSAETVDMGARQSSPLVFVITGCASGIGKHLATRAVAAGHNVLATGLHLEALATLADQLGWQAPRVQLNELDVRDPAGWEATIARAVATWGRVDVLLNVAGIVLPGNVHEISAEAMLAHLEVNARGTMLGTQVAARQMVQQRKGHIVNIASLAGIAAVPGIASYTASKFAVRGFSLAVAHELAPHGVAVTCICPDAVETPMLDFEMSHDAAALSFSASRFLTVDDVGRAVFDRALVRKPLEIMLPAARGWLAKLTSLFPSTESWLLPKMLRDSRRRQSEYRQRREKG